MSRSLNRGLPVVLAAVGALTFGACSGGSSTPPTDRASNTAPESGAPAASSSNSGSANGAAGAHSAGAGATSAAGQPLTATAAAATPGAGLGPTVLSVPETVKPGQTVTAAFQTRPGSTCQLALTGGGNSSQGPFEPMVADAAGRVAWTWRLAPDTDTGTLEAWVSCSGGGTAQAEMTVT